MAQAAAATSTAEVQPMQAEQQQTPREGNKRRGRNNNRGNSQRGGGKNRREIKNVFGDAIVASEQIRDTCLENAQKSFMAPEQLLERLQGKSEWAKQMRVHERVCEVDDRFSVVDFSLKAKSRRSKDIDHAYF